MKKINKKTLILTSVVTLLPIVIGLALWNQLPDTIPTHFGMDGTPNGWSSKEFTVFGMPVLLLVFHLLCVAGTSQDPKYDNMNDKLFALVLWICPIISWLVPISCYAAALGIEMNITRYAMIGVGFVLMIVGNYLPKCKQNYTMGIKIPWTLDDEENWNHTHRMAGFLWVAGGVFLMINAFLEWEWLFLVIIVIMTGVPMLYSYLYYRRNRKKRGKQ